MVAEHTRDAVDTPAHPLSAIKTADNGWAGFWDGHLDLDPLAGVGPAAGACIRAYFGDESAFASARKRPTMSASPLKLVLEDHAPAVPGDQQGRAGTAASGVLPSRQRRPELGVSWHKAAAAIKAEATRRIARTDRLAGVNALGFEGMP